MSINLSYSYASWSQAPELPLHELTKSFSFLSSSSSILRQPTFMLTAHFWYRLQEQLGVAGLSSSLCGISYYFLIFQMDREPQQLSTHFSSLWTPERIKPLFQGVQPRMSLVHSSGMNGSLWFLHTWGPGGDVSKQPGEESVWWTICHIS